MSYLKEQHKRHPLVISMDTLLFIIIIAKTWMYDALTIRVGQRESVCDPAVSIQHVRRHSSIVDAWDRVTWNEEYGALLNLYFFYIITYGQNHCGSCLPTINSVYHLLVSKQENNGLTCRHSSRWSWVRFRVRITKFFGILCSLDDE